MPIGAVDRSDVIALVLPNLNSAFNAVEHSTLISTPHRLFSVNKVPLCWFRSYLSDRSLSDHFAGENIDVFPIICSMPEGSVLCSRVFIAYTMEMKKKQH